MNDIFPQKIAAQNRSFNHSDGSSRFHQRGVTLVLVLMFLSLMLIVAAGVARNVTQQEKMLGSSRDKNLSFQAAESALKVAEACLVAETCGNALKAQGWSPALSAQSSSFVNAKSAYCDEKLGWQNACAIYTSSANYWDLWTKADWETHAAQVKEDEIPEIQKSTGIHTLPYYLIETLDDLTFRVTAYGIGGSNQSDTLLQATYTKQ